MRLSASLPFRSLGDLTAYEVTYGRELRELYDFSTARSVLTLRNERLGSPFKLDVNSSQRQNWMQIIRGAQGLRALRCFQRLTGPPLRCLHVAATSMSGTSAAASSSPPPPPPLPPTGYSFLRASAGQILLPLTISNQCGQSFRWRRVKVWEEVRRGEDGPAASLAHQNGNVAKTEASSVKTEPANAAVPTNPVVKVEPVEGDPLPDAVMETPPHGSPALDDEQAESKLKLDLSTSVPMQEWDEFSFCLPDRVVLVRQDEERGWIYHRTILPSSLAPAEEIEKETQDWLSDYLNLAVPLESLYEEWAARDAVFGRFAQRFRGIRMLRQDPWECLCAFICSSNNNIARIGQMVQNLCTHFSPRLLSHAAIDYHPFPSPHALATDGVEEKLRNLGFGYRARYIHQTAKMLCELCPVQVEGADTSLRVLREIQDPRQFVKKEDDKPLVKVEEENKPNNVKSEGDGITPTALSVHAYLASLRSTDYHTARSELLKFQGIGPKVADCILLMSLDQAASIPVDRHVFQFAAKWYGLRNAKYETLAEYFRNLWGEYAGWAHSVLFTADLRAFKDYDGHVVKTENGVKKEEAAMVVKDAIDADVKPEIDSKSAIDRKTTVTTGKRKTRNSMTAAEAETATATTMRVSRARRD